MVYGRSSVTKPLVMGTQFLKILTSLRYNFVKQAYLDELQVQNVLCTGGGFVSQLAGYHLLHYQLEVGM